MLKVPNTHTLCVWSSVRLYHSLSKSANFVSFVIYRKTPIILLDMVGLEIKKKKIVRKRAMGLQKNQHTVHKICNLFL